MEIEISGSSSPISCEVLGIEDNYARDDCESRRKLEFKDDDDFFNTDVPIKEEGEQDVLLNSLDATSDINLLHSQIPHEAIPKLDMKFKTEEAAYEFYNAYAYKVGFSVRRSKEYKDKSGMLVTLIFCCSCEGKRGKDKRDSIIKSHRPETRFGCLAQKKIKYCRQTKQYYVAEFNPVHNHAVCTPSKTHLHKSHRKLSVAQAVELDMGNDYGIGPKATVEFMARQAGGRENLGFIPQDYKNYLRSKRTVQMKRGDTGGVLEYLQKMQLEDPNFFYAIQVDEDDLITNIFWADAKMMADYAHFGDVVSFDTTYRKNKDGRPFAMFVGVNHHKQTVVFGAALLYSESADSFIWLFDIFAKAMGGKTPKTILTDQDAAMAKALAAQWPETIHRLCIWHIYQNAASKLSGAFARFKDFSKDFSECIYDYEDEDEFINAWNAMLERYNLQDNDWLKRMFNQKEKWALVYGRQTFCADMTTTQRSESMNSVLKRYASYKHDLLQFFHHFQRLVDDRRYEELKADFRATQSTPSLSFPVEMLKHAASMYTPDVFVLFQRELSKAHDCNLKKFGESGTVTKYDVSPYGKDDQHHLVTFDSSADMVLCSCKKFEFVGLLCSHALKVLCHNNVMRIPEKYILKRWTKNAKSGSTGTCARTSLIEDPKAMMGR
ncbi:protein FAR1-RELATED SEQUENCE 5-like isoform X1 [Rhododendron vialii]|uniref:protein FAR1-RELATED SEQUENCE 5-like isoform X1 n=2 Tax=Rhododendron vialii TaxID=182163 RepID=UPI00265E3BEB|nr:protein FAR1-RELATED SEQUENCE 5-like isoform X1 [Rhododendron vialii]